MVQYGALPALVKKQPDEKLSENYHNHEYMFNEIKKQITESSR